LTWPGGPSYTASMADADKKCARQRFLDFLARKGLRLTGQRRAIIEAVFSTEKHFTAEELLGWAQRRDKSISRATVYRTLPLLTESGLVREMDFGGDHKFYDPNYAEHPRHSHIICRLGFQVAAHRLQITATCEEFRKLGACSKRNN